MWKNWKKEGRSLASYRKRGQVDKDRHQRQLRLEALEERRLLSTDPYEWIGDENDDWSDGGNWHNDLLPPGDGDTARFSSLAERNPRLTENTTVGAINAESGSDIELNVNGRTLETKLTTGPIVGIRVNDGATSGPVVGAKLEIINTGSGPKTVTAPTVKVGGTGTLNNNYAEMSITTSKVKLVCSGDLLVGGKKNRGTLTLGGGESQAQKVFAGGATAPIPGKDYSGQIALASNAKLTASNGVVIGKGVSP